MKALLSLLFLLALLLTSPAWAVELDQNSDGKLDDEFIPSTVTRDTELSSGLATKQNTLGFTPENAAYKGQANGYAGLGADGIVPAGQLPTPTTDTDDQTATEVPATPWGSYLGTNVQALVLEVDTALRALIGDGSMTWPGSAGVAVYGGAGTWSTSLAVGTGANNLVQLNASAQLPAVSGANLTNLPAASLPSWLPSTGPTADNQIIQATGEGASAWTDIIDGLINDAGTGTDDLLSAAEIASRMTSKMATPGPIGSTTPNTGAFTSLTATSFDFGAPDTGETGEIGLQEDPANGANVVTLKAPAALAADLVITLPAGAVPASATAPCTAGQWWYDASYWYVCVAADTWKRAALATW